MLRITIPEQSLWDPANEEFLYTKEQTITLEHSLLSISKWESKWNVSFLSSSQKLTNEQLTDYIRCMTLTQNVDPLIYNCLTNENLKAINDYIAAPMTATTITRQKKGPSREKITSELIYYWMVALQIPFECQKWHINRLLTLIEVCNIKNAPPKKMGKRDLMARNKSLNAARRKAHNTKG
jgi:hypothetical protein